MDIDLLLSQGLAITLIVGGGAFAWGQAWPYLRDRDVEERERGYTLRLQSQQHEESMAQSLARVAKALENPVVKVLQQTDND